MSARASYGGADMPKPTFQPQAAATPAPQMNMGMSLEEQAKKRMEQAYAGLQAAKVRCLANLQGASSAY